MRISPVYWQIHVLPILFDGTSVQFKIKKEKEVLSQWLSVTIEQFNTQAKSQRWHLYTLVA